jgi:hypothetical protein
LYSILFTDFFFFLLSVPSAVFIFQSSCPLGGGGGWVLLSKGTLVHVCLLAHLSMKIFYDIKENLLKWLFFKEDNLCGFSFLRFLRGVASLLISAYFNFLEKYCLLK